MKWLRDLFVVLLSTAVFIAALELTTRLFIPHPAEAPEPIVPDELLNHAWRPSMRYLELNHSIPFVITTNSQRWLEEREVPEAKPPKTFRIFYLGDSTTQGVVAQDKKMVKIVERRLNEIYRPKGVAIEVINTGTSSYATSQYYLIATKILPHYSPDLVVIDVDMTDVPDDSLYRKLSRFDENGDLVAVQSSVEEMRRYRLTPYGTIERRPIERLADWVARHSEFFRRMRAGVASAAPSKPIYELRDLSLPANWLSKRWTDGIRSHVAYSMGNIAKAIRFLKARGVRVVVTGVPDYFQFAGRDSLEPMAAIEKTARENGALYLDSFGPLKPKIAGTAVTDFFWDNDPHHFNEKGNTEWAKIQLEFLLKNRTALLP